MDTEDTSEDMEATGVRNCFNTKNHYHLSVIEVISSFDFGKICLVVIRQMGGSTGYLDV